MTQLLKMFLKMLGLMHNFHQQRFHDIFLTKLRYRYHEPEYLPPIDLRVENRRRRYEEGKLHHLSQSVHVLNAKGRFDWLLTVT